MNRLRDHVWAPKYHSDAGALVQLFYVPALACLSPGHKVLLRLCPPTPPELERTFS